MMDRHEERKEMQEFKVFKEYQELKVMTEFKEQQELMELKAFKEYQEIVEVKVFKELYTIHISKHKRQAKIVYAVLREKKKKTKITKHT